MLGWNSCKEGAVVLFEIKVEIEVELLATALPKIMNRMNILQDSLLTNLSAIGAP